MPAGGSGRGCWWGPLPRAGRSPTVLCGGGLPGFPRVCPRLPRASRVMLSLLLDSSAPDPEEPRDPVGTSAPQLLTLHTRSGLGQEVPPRASF